jgi:murein DD-endopeptidase MepM/ murein hydrolase activator NlpD
LKGNKRTRRAERVFLKKYVFSLKRETKPRLGLRSWDPYEYITLAIGVVFILVLAGWLVSEVFFSTMDQDINLVSPEMLAQEPEGNGAIIVTPAVQNTDSTHDSTKEEPPEKAVPAKPAKAISTYTLQRHDTLGKIAKRNGIKLQTLLAANPDLNPRKLKKGMIVTIPSQDGLVYEVAKGDTIGSLAKRYAISPKEIAKANNISIRQKLVPDQKLLLPGARMLVAKNTEPQKEVKAELASHGKETPQASKHSSLKEELMAKLPVSGKVESSANADADEESFANQEVQDDEPSADKSSGKLVSTPAGFINPTGGKLTSGFGYRRHPMGGGVRLHRGIDIANKKGTTIVAAKSGKVVHAGWYGLMGKTVIIQHDDGIATYYGHMSEVTVTEGQAVHQGQKIGEMGSTGLSTGSHLHFEVRKNNVPLDPVKVLKLK